MSTRTYSGRFVANVLADHGFEPKNRSGSHLSLQYEHPDNDDDVRNVTVPVEHDELRRGTLRSIAKQAGAKDFDSFCAWLDRCD